MECKPEQVQALLIEQRAVMSHFCYGYTRALLNKLKKLQEEDRIFSDGLEDAQENATLGHRNEFTSIADVVINHLTEQVSNSPFKGDLTVPDGVEDYISLLEEFLAIFEQC